MAVLGSADISTTLVGNTLGVSSRDVSTLCTHANINKFSKYKPVEFNSSIGLTEIDFSSINYGLDIEEMSDVKNTQNKEWKYNKPSSYGKRLGDFRQYNHTAPIALLQNKGTTFSVNRFDGAGKAIGFTIKQFPSGEELFCLNVSNLTPVGGSDVLLNNYYLAAAIYQGATLKGTYYSYSTIKYSEGVGADLNGATIVLSSGTYMNSDDDPIEDYVAGSYTIYLYITNFDMDIPIGELRKYWPINYNSSYPQSISTTILGLNDVFNIELLGIRPIGGVWADSSTDFKYGTISQAVRGTYYRFDAKIRINNETASTVYLDLGNLFLFYNYITTWGGTISRKSEGAGSGTISIGASTYYDLTVNFITPLPATIVDTTGSLSLGLQLHLGNDDSGEQFEELLPRVIVLEYND